MKRERGKMMSVEPGGVGEWKKSDEEDGELPRCTRAYVEIRDKGQNNRRG